MIAIGILFIRMLSDFFKPRARLEAEILVLRHQLNILQQRAPRRPRLGCVGIGWVLPLIGDGSLAHMEVGRGLPKRYGT